MTLVSYEFVSCQSKNARVLVSELWCQSLGAGALLVNPWNVNDMAAAIEDALTMPDSERRERQRQNFTHVTIHRRRHGQIRLSQSWTIRMLRRN